MKPISILWAQYLELGDRNFNEVPDKLKDEVLQKLTEDGYAINGEGWAVKI